MELIEEYKNYLGKFLSFKSVSTDPAYKGEIEKTAQFLKDLFERNGFEVKLLSYPELNPVVFANYHFDNRLPTLLIYGHYDVQPASEKEWGYNPFQLTIKGERFYGRGVVDNKGQVLIHITNAFHLLKEGKLAYNLKFLIEGNEETGSVEELSDLIKEKKGLFKSDYVLISDGELVGEKPTIEASFRGGFNVRLEYQGAKTNVHSGIYGGAVVNVAKQLSHFISQLVDERNYVFLPGFYDDVDEITKEQLENNKALMGLAGNPAIEAGFRSLRLGRGNDFYTTTGLYPTIEVTGLKSGYIDEGFANIVPAIAEAKFNFRLVTSQKSKDIYQKFEQFVKEKTPSDVKYQLEATGFHEPVKLDTKEAIFQKARKILADVYGEPILYHCVGGAIPFIGTMKELFAINPLSVGLANQDCHMHGVNENFRIDLIKRGLSFSYCFLKK